MPLHPCATVLCFPRLACWSSLPGYLLCTSGGPAIPIVCGETGRQSRRLLLALIPVPLYQYLSCDAIVQAVAAGGFFVEYACPGWPQKRGVLERGQSKEIASVARQQADQQLR